MTWHAKRTINDQAAWTPVQKAKVESTLRLWSQLHQVWRRPFWLFDFQVSLLIHQLLVPVKILKPPKDQETDPNRFEWTKKLQLEVQLNMTSWTNPPSCDMLWSKQNVPFGEPFSPLSITFSREPSFGASKMRELCWQLDVSSIQKKGMLWASVSEIEKMDRGPSDLAPRGGF